MPRQHSGYGLSSRGDGEPSAAAETRLNRRKRELTPRQWRWIDRYIETGDAHQSLLDAGYSPRTARQVRALLRRPAIQQELTRRREDAAARARLTQDRVIRELARVALSDVTAIVEVQDGAVSLRDSAEWGADAAATVAEVSQSRQGVRVRLWSKTDALAELAKRLWPAPEAPAVQVQALTSFTLQIGDGQPETEPELQLLPPDYALLEDPIEQP